MEKLDKVIAGLEHCTDKDCGCEDCPYYDDADCENRVVIDAVALIRELEQKYRAAVEMAAIATERAAARTGGDLISRAELIGTESLLMTDIVESDPVAKFVLEQVLHDIKAAPAVAAEPVVHAHWKDEYGGKYANPRYRCSACKEKALYKFELNELDQWKEVQALTQRCPNCGAHMDGERRNDG